MSTAVTQKTTRWDLLFSLYTMMILVTFMMMIIRSPENVRNSIEVELGHALEHLGEEDQRKLERVSTDRFQHWLHDSGLYETVYNALKPKKQSEGMERWQQNATKNFLHEGWIYRLLENFQLFSYQIIHRLTLMEFWVWTMLPATYAIIMTGYYNWKIKKYQLSGQSTAQVRVWLKIMWVLQLIFAVYLITPNLFGVYTIFAPAMLMLLLGLAVSLILSSFGKAV